MFHNDSHSNQLDNNILTMQKLTSLYFPETIAQYPDFRQLLLFVDSIKQYLPSEDSITPESPLVKAGLLEQHTPVPFGDDLPNFQRLMKDMRGHGNEFYGNYLSSLSAASSIDVDEASVWQLISQMNTEKKNIDTNSHKDTLLQARLLLKLAEVRATDEQELLEKMSDLNGRKDKLFSALKGEGEDSAIFQDFSSAPELENPARLKQRFKAWTHLFLCDKQPCSGLAITGSNEILELLKEHSDTMAVSKLFEISLADFSSAEVEGHSFLELQQDFQNSTIPHREILLNHLLAIAETGTSKDSSSLAEPIKGWNQAIEKLDHSSLATLELYLFRTPMPQLFSKASGIDEMFIQKETSLPNTIIGVLR
jgi:hypothetical protein